MFTPFQENWPYYHPPKSICQQKFKGYLEKSFLAAQNILSTILKLV